MNRSMYQLQAELHECLKEYDTTGFEWYCPDNWVPHCTLALTREDEDDLFYRASELILREFTKMSGEFVSIGLGKITAPVSELCILELGK